MAASMNPDGEQTRMRKSLPPRLSLEAVHAFGSANFGLPLPKPSSQNFKRAPARQDLKQRDFSLKQKNHTTCPYF